MTCIFSTLLFVIDQSEKLRIQTPVITFDQPLWLKAMEIASAKSLHIVPVLGEFHLMMSFAGSIGSLMKGSGLMEALQNVYAENTVEHILSGKAIARALRGHFLIESALTTKLLRKFIPSKCDIDSDFAGDKSIIDDKHGEIDVDMQPDTDFEVVGALNVMEQMFNDNEINELKSLES